MSLYLMPRSGNPFRRAVRKPSDPKHPNILGQTIKVLEFPANVATPITQQDVPFLLDDIGAALVVCREHKKGHFVMDGDATDDAVCDIVAVKERKKLPIHHWQQCVVDRIAAAEEALAKAEKEAAEGGGKKKAASNGGKQGTKSTKTARKAG